MAEGNSDVRIGTAVHCLLKNFATIWPLIFQYKSINMINSKNENMNTAEAKQRESTSFQSQHCKMLFNLENESLLDVGRITKPR